MLTAGLLGYQTAQSETLPTIPVPIIVQAAKSFNGVPDLPIIDTTTSADSVRIITGRVSENVNNTALGGVNIIIKGTSTGTTTDSAGQFQLSIPMEQKDDLITLVVAYIGFQSYEIQRRPNQSDPVLVNLNEDTTTLGEMVVVGGYKKLSLWKRLRNRFRASH